LKTTHSVKVDFLSVCVCAGSLLLRLVWFYCVYIWLRASICFYARTTTTTRSSGLRL